MKTTIKKCREIYSKFGLPMQITSDNGCTFTFSEFQNFLQQNNIKHKLTAPYNPTMNGQIERFVQILKKYLFSLNTLNINVTTFTDAISHYSTLYNKSLS